MASWGMARQVAELCMFGIGGHVALGIRASVHLPLRRGFHYLPQRLAQSFVSATSESSVGFPRPGEIPWQKKFVNSVDLIGRINQSVDIKYLDSGKIVATTSLRVDRKVVSRGVTDHTLFSLQFWDELAEIAAAHLKKEDNVYVAGSVWVESFVDKESMSKSICKVVARDLKFVGSRFQTSNEEKAEGGTEHEVTENIEALWRSYFENPLDFWDNRLSKANSRNPDFKHKINGAVLWVDSRDTPSWVHNQLAQAPPNMTKAEKAKELEKLWQMFFADPLDWWDNRISKKSSKSPDFKNKSTGEALWVSGTTTPNWVKSQLELLDSKAKSLKQGGANSEWASASSKEKTPKTSFQDEDLMFF